jgi:hypothetical protein
LGVFGYTIALGTAFANINRATRGKNIRCPQNEGKRYSCAKPALMALRWKSRHHRDALNDVQHRLSASGAADPMSHVFLSACFSKLLHQPNH